MYESFIKGKEKLTFCGAGLALMFLVYKAHRVIVVKYGASRVSHSHGVPVQQSYNLCYLHMLDNLEMAFKAGGE